MNKHNKLPASGTIFRRYEGDKIIIRWISDGGHDDKVQIISTEEEIVDDTKAWLAFFGDSIDENTINNSICYMRVNSNSPSSILCLPPGDGASVKPNYSGDSDALDAYWNCLQLCPSAEDNLSRYVLCVSSCIPKSVTN